MEDFSSLSVNYPELWFFTNSLKMNFLYKHTSAHGLFPKYSVLPCFGVFRYSLVLSLLFLFLLLDQIKTVFVKRREIKVAVWTLLWQSFAELHSANSWDFCFLRTFLQTKIKSHISQVYENVKDLKQIRVFWINVYDTYLL